MYDESRMPDAFTVAGRPVLNESIWSAMRVQPTVLVACIIGLIDEGSMRCIA